MRVFLVLRLSQFFKKEFSLIFRLTDDLKFHNDDLIVLPFDRFVMNGFVVEKTRYLVNICYQPALPVSPRRHTDQFC